MDFLMSRKRNGKQKAKSLLLCACYFANFASPRSSILSSPLNFASTTRVYSLLPTCPPIEVLKSEIPGMKQEVMRNRAREVEDVMELMHLIQSRLPVEEAARTSILSNSWLHAWSTIPNLRFRVRKDKETKNMKLVDVDRTLTRYLRDNIPIEMFDLDINIENKESASHAEDLIRSVATKTCLKEFSLYVSLFGGPVLFTLLDEILSAEHLTTIRVSGWSGGTHDVRMTRASHHPVIKCVSLRELHLYSVHISEEALHHILSSCSLLVKIELILSCKGFETIRVKNLARLYEFTIFLDDQQSTALEISDVPNLGVFSYLQYVQRRYVRDPRPFDAHSISLGSSVTRLMLGGVIADNACLDMIKS